VGCALPIVAKYARFTLPHLGQGERSALGSASGLRAEPQSAHSSGLCLVFMTPNVRVKRAPAAGRQGPD
jgi:hypothetical protein